MIDAALSAPGTASPEHAATTTAEFDPAGAEIFGLRARLTAVLEILREHGLELGQVELTRARQALAAHDAAADVRAAALCDSTASGERDALRTRLAEVTREREDALLDVAGSEAEDAAAIAAAERRGAQAMREHCAVAINGRCNQATMLDQRNAVEFLALGLSDIRALPLPGDEQAGEKA